MKAQHVFQQDAQGAARRSPKERGKAAGHKGSSQQQGRPLRALLHCSWSAHMSGADISNLKPKQLS